MKTKDQQLSEPMECEDCGKICQGIQGIRGHRRACPGRKPVALNQVSKPQEVVEPVNHSGSREAVQETIFVGSRLDQEAAEQTMEIHEETEAQLTDIVESLILRKVSDSYARSRNWPTYEDWCKVTMDIYRLKLSVEKIVKQARVSRDLPWELYQRALSIRERWARWRREEAYRCWEQQSEESRPEFEEVLRDSGIPELEASWSRIVAGLRWLTSHTKATLELR